MKMLCNNKGKVGAGKDKGYEQYLYTHTNISLITVVFTHFISHLFNTANTIKLLLSSITTNGLHYVNRRVYQVNKVLTNVNKYVNNLYTPARFLAYHTSTIFHRDYGHAFAKERPITRIMLTYYEILWRLRRDR